MRKIFENDLKDDLKVITLAENNCDYRACMCVTKNHEIIYYNKALKKLIKQDFN